MSVCDCVNVWTRAQYRQGHTHNHTRARNNSESTPSNVHTTSRLFVTYLAVETLPHAPTVDGFGHIAKDTRCNLHHFRRPDGTTAVNPPAGEVRSIHHREESTRAESIRQEATQEMRSVASSNQDAKRAEVDTHATGKMPDVQRPTFLPVAVGLTWRTEHNSGGPEQNLRTVAAGASHTARPLLEVLLLVLLPFLFLSLESARPSR
jgi:hypothetical protein